MGLLDEVIVISDDEGSITPRRSKRLRPNSAGTTSAQPSVVVVDISKANNIVDIMDDDSDVEFVDVKPATGSATMRSDKGKGVMLYPQQQALQDSHDAMMSHARDRLRHGEDGLQQELTATVANLPLNLPEQLEAFHCLGKESAVDRTAVTRRDLLELCGSAETRRVERLIYQAASRAVQAQLNADGTVKKQAAPEVAEAPTSSGHGEAYTAQDPLSPGSRATRAARHHRSNRQGGPASPADSLAPGVSSRQGGKGKRKAGQEGSTAQQAQHVLKRKERVQSCPMCSAAQIVACDKLDSLPVAQLKLVMGSRGLSPGKSHKACCDGLAEACQGLSHICLLCHASICSRTGDIRPHSKGQQYGSLLPTCPPMGLSAVLHGGPFAASLRLLLQNDSIMEIGAHARTYGELLRLLSLLGSSIDLAPLLYQPADFEQSEDTAKQGGSDKTGQTPSVLDALQKLSQQCHIFKKSAEHLASGSAEDIGALSLALQIIDADQELQESMAHLKKLSASDAAQTVAGAATPAKGPSEGPSPATEKRLRGKQLAAANAAAAAAAKAAQMQALHAKYVNALQPYTFREFDLMSPEARFYFHGQAKTSKSGGGEVMRKWLRRVSAEHASLSASLPPAWTSSVFLAADPSRLDVLRALIIGPADTPYANGCFLFDIFLPAEYPNTPPKVQFLTTGGGRVRFNPNLYDNGKVCLSLLGTWAGPSWDAAHSTLLQVLISIQSMILVSDPYYNEPGYESSRGTTSGNQQCENYNRQQECNTACHSILAALRQPDPCFHEIIRTHYALKRSEVQQQLQDWLLVADKKTIPAMKEATKSIQAELQKLPGL